MSTNEDLYDIPLGTPKLKNNQLKIFKNVSEFWNFALENVCLFQNSFV